MIIKFIDTNGNFSTLETLTDPKWEERLERNGNVWFEKRVKIEAPKQKEKKVEEIKEEVNNEDIEAKAKAFCKENKVRWYGLLKWEKLISKAKENGFII